jgi:flagellar biosynthesis protein FlhG
MTLAGPRLTTIGSGKGGTGKTFVALTLAQAFADLGEHVLVCDADLGLSNTSVHLGLPHCGDLPGFLAGRTPLQNAIATVETASHGSFDLLAAPAGSGFLADADAVTLARLSTLLRRANGYDRIVIDLGAGIGETVMSLAAESDDVVVVLTPDPAALTDAYAFIKLVLKRTGGRTPALLVNMASSAPEAKRTAEALTNAARTGISRFRAERYACGGVLASADLALAGLSAQPLPRRHQRLDRPFGWDHGAYPSRQFTALTINSRPLCQSGPHSLPGAERCMIVHQAGEQSISRQGGFTRPRGNLCLHSCKSGTPFRVSCCRPTTTHSVRQL